MFFVLNLCSKQRGLEQGSVGSMGPKIRIFLNSGFFFNFLSDDIIHHCFKLATDVRGYLARSNPVNGKVLGTRHLKMRSFCNLPSLFCKYCLVGISYLLIIDRGIKC